MLNHKPCFRGIINVNVLMLSTFTVNNIMYRAQLFEYNNKIHPKIDQPERENKMIRFCSLRNIHNFNTVKHCVHASILADCDTTGTLIL